MIIKGESPDYLISHFELSYEEEANFLHTFISENERIIFPYFSRNFKNAEPAWKQFVEDRTLFISESWSFYDWLHKNVYWYSPNNTEELIQILKDDYLYVCYVIPKDQSNVNHYKYFIHVAEHLVDEEEDPDDEFRGMFLEAEPETRFEQDVFPKLEEQFHLQNKLG